MIFKKDYDSGLYPGYSKRGGRLGFTRLLSGILLPLLTLYLIFAGSFRDEILFPLLILLSFALAFFTLKNWDEHYVIAGFQGIILGLVLLRLWYYLDASVTALANPWRPFLSGLAAAVLCAFFFFPVIRRKKGTTKFLRTILAAFLVGMAFYQAVLTCNVIYDNSAPAYTTATVLEKSRLQPSRRGIRYYVRLELKEPVPEKNNSMYSCTYNQYERFKDGETVLVSRHAGLLKIPWIRVEQNPASR